ncbi:MAG: leucine-rich repeat domain-containing protein [Ruminococcaceae bacterium]|nr:leucine-rich repeat domain-containing protein [Oscillospiraceae bacterium]
MKKLFSFILIITTLLYLCVVTVSAKDIGDNLSWKLENGVLSISGSGDMAELESAEEYPWHAERSKISGIVISNGITSVSDHAFSGCRILFNVSIASTVKSIGTHAFENCQSLKEIKIPSSVTEIGEYAFYNCTAIRDMYLNAQITEISEYAFANCKSVNIITLPSSLRSIGAHGFEGCAGLFSINFNSSLTKIGEKAFYDCKALENIKLPLAVSRIGADAFVNTANYNNAANWSDNGLYINSRLVSVKNDRVGEFIIKDGTSYVAEKTFSNASFDYVTIPESVTSIESNAFDESGASIRCYEGSYAENYAKTNGIPYELITVLAEPVFKEFGLQLTLSEIEDVAVIRTCYGDLESEAEIKRGEESRSFNSKHTLKGASSFTLQYRKEGLVSVYVRYNDGHSIVYKYNVTKKTPKLTSAGNTVNISGLKDFLVIRYAKGEYTTSNALKNAPDCTNISRKNHNEDSICFTLENATYTFCVQYKDESYNFYTVKTDSEKPKIYCVGDSLTMGIETGWGNIVDVPYPERLEENTGYITYNYGVGSDITEQIAMRMGSTPVYVKDITIPSDTTPVALTPYYEDGSRIQGFCYNGFAGINDVEIAGVKGKLTDVNGDDSDHGINRIYFKRNEPGDEIRISSPERIVTNFEQQITSDDILIIWTGSNDLDDADDTSYFEYFVEMQEQMIEFSGVEKFLIIGYTADNYIGVDGYTECADEYNALMKEYWGENFVDLKEYMATYRALEEHAIEPTADDHYRLARGWIPKSFLERGRNNIHFNQIGYDCVEYLIENKLLELGYIEI